MIQVQLTSEIREALFREQFIQLHPHVAKKILAVYLKSCELHNDLICKILRIDGNTLRSYFKAFNSGGISQLKVVKFYRPQSDLQEFSGTIEDYFQANPPKSISEAAAKIKKLTGIERKETQVRKFLKDMGFRHLKVGTVPAKALTEGKKTSNENFWKKT